MDVFFGDSRENSSDSWRFCLGILKKDVYVRLERLMRVLGAG